MSYISLRINFHLRSLIVEFHITLPHSSATLHRLHPLLQSVLLHLTFSSRLADPRNRQSRLVSAKHGSHDRWLDSRDTSVRIAHLCPRDHTAFDDLRRLRTEIARVPEHQVSDLAHFDRAHEMRHALRNSRVDGVLAHVALDAEVVSVSAFVFG